MDGNVYEQRVRVWVLDGLTWGMNSGLETTKARGDWHRLILGQTACLYTTT